MKSVAAALAVLVALGLAGWLPIAEASTWVEPPGLDEQVRAITDAPDHPLLGLYLDILLIATGLLAALIFVSGIDDAFIDACYWLKRLERRRRTVPAAELLSRPPAPFAIMVPAWKEHDVIAAMIDNTVKTLDYEAYRIFCGVYRNDPATASEVDRMAALYPDRVTRVEVPHDGPTCKADCLNSIVRRVLTEEHCGGTRFAGMVLHDSEDVIHPLELRLFNTLVPGKDLVQLPVFSLERKWSDLTAGTYVDDFAESHGKDIAVREALVGIVPGAGVATCYSRRCMAGLWNAAEGEPFNTGSLTEDYDLSFRLARLGMAETFAHVAVDDERFRPASARGTTGKIVSTHEFFPDRFKAAYRQRARWVIGIAFQGWQQIGWQGGWRERYFLFRDRKAVVMAPACIAAYLLVLQFVLGMAFGPQELRDALRSLLSLPVLAPILALNLAFMLNRAAQRVYFVGRYYGATQAALSLARMPVNNLINFFAVMRAWRLFIAHLATGKKLAWDKTAHVFPEALTPRLKALCLAAASCVAMLVGTVSEAAAPPLTGQGYQLADRAYKAIENGRLEEALRLSTDALKHAPGHPALLLLQGDILSRQGRHAEAAERVRNLFAADLGAEGLAQRGYIRLKTDEAAAERDFTEAIAAGGLSAEQRANVASELAYLALRRKDDEAALRWFKAALERPGAPAGLHADAAYAASRLGDNLEAVRLFSAAIDASHAAPQGAKPFDETALFGLRRAVDTLSRRWGATFSIGHSSTQAAAGSGLAATGGDLRVVQAGAEVFYRPEGFGYRDGRVFELYANAFQGLSASEPEFATGSTSRVASVGARYKPLREHNLVLALERRLAVGSRAGDDDWLVRVGWSASGGTDWDAARDAWTSWQVYTESVYFTRAERLIQPFEARLGRSRKIAGWHGAVVTPFIGFGGEYDKAQQPKTAAGIGPGVAIRYWFGESRHRAFPGHLDFSVQYRFRITDATRGEGLFAQLSVSF